MKIRHHEIEINPENPFANCKLERQKYAEILTEIVGAYPDGFVLSINNEWGTGKTTFVKMWRQHLTNSGYQTVYFNAWQNDFTPDPLVAIMSELKAIASDTKAKKAFKSALQKGAVFAKAVLPVAAKGFAKAYGFDVDGVASAAVGATTAATEVFEKHVDEYVKKKNTIADFRIKLAEFADEVRGEKPLVFIVDELDRCRPDYAVEVLEQIKHLFAVSGITFVLSIDKGHLAASVKGFYGSEHINTDEYLRRFIDLEYSIPRPSTEQFCKYLYDFYLFHDFFISEARLKFSIFQSDGPNFVSMSSMLCEHSNSTLRQMEKIFGQVRLILRMFDLNHFVFPEVLFFLVFSAVMKPAFYSKLKRGQLELQEICEEYEALVPVNDERRNRFLLWTEANILVLYNNEFNLGKDALITKGDDGEMQTSLSSRFDIDNKSELARAISYVGSDFERSRISLGHLTRRIELTEPLVFE